MPIGISLVPPALLHALQTGTIKSDNSDGNENIKKAKRLNLTTTLFVRTLFCTFRCRHCTTPTQNCRFYEGREHATRNVSCPELGYGS